MKLLLLLFAPLFCFSQKAVINLKSGGTYIVACIGKDNEIVIASDTRSSFPDDQGRISVYYEECPKIFNCQNIAFAISGSYSFDNIELVGLINEFNETHKLPILVNRFLNEFLSFSKTQLSKLDFENVLLKNRFVVCGFQNSKPAIYWYNQKEKDSIFTIGYKTNSSADNDSRLIRTTIMPLISSKPITEIILEMNKLVEIAENDIRNVKSREVGGPISIATIVDGKFEWKQNNNKHFFNTMKDFAFAFDKLHLKMWYASPIDSLIFRTELKREGYIK